MHHPAGCRQAKRRFTRPWKTLRDALMDETASALPEYPVVMAMNGVGSTLGPQLMAEIGDVTRFTHKGAVTAFAGVYLV